MRLQREAKQKQLVDLWLQIGPNAPDLPELEFELLHQQYSVVSSELNTGGSDNCSICLENMADGSRSVVQAVCGHTLCLYCFMRQHREASDATPGSVDAAAGAICTQCRTNYFTAMPAVSVDILGMPLRTRLCAATAVWNLLTANHAAQQPHPNEIVTGMMAVNDGLAHDDPARYLYTGDPTFGGRHPLR
jgi:hypothetical protein